MNKEHTKYSLPYTLAADVRQIIWHSTLSRIAGISSSDICHIDLGSLHSYLRRDDDFVYLHPHTLCECCRRLCHGITPTIRWGIPYDFGNLVELVCFKGNGKVDDRTLLACHVNFSECIKLVLRVRIYVHWNQTSKHVGNLRMLSCGAVKGLSNCKTFAGEDPSRHMFVLEAAVVDYILLILLVSETNHKE